jgi:probable HAF family extracellular repeat protein
VSFLALSACSDSTSPSSETLTVVSITDLGTVPTETFPQANAVNDAGQFVGYYIMGSGATSIRRPVRFQAGTIVDISGMPPNAVPLPVTQSAGFATAINAGGVAGGDLPGIQGSTSLAQSRAALFRSGAVEILPIPRPTRADPASVRGLNDAGDAVGYALYAPPVQTTTVPTQAALWRRGAVPIHLGALTATTGSVASDINNNGQIVGAAFDASKRLHAVRFDLPAPPTDLGALPGHDYANAEAINDAGIIVGYSTTATGTGSGRLADSRAVRWENGQIMQLAMLPGHTASEAYAINEAGDIVGMSLAPDGTRRAVLWRGETVLELGLLEGETTSVARGINDKGDVVGGSGTHAVHWKISPVLAPNATR